MGRLVGVDLARALAVFGMYIVHIGPPLSATHGVASWIRYIADGHSSVLFATLAGFSLMLIAGRREPKTGLAGRQAKARIAIRALVLLALGTALAVEYGGVIILGFYGVYFLLALPLVRLRARTLAIIAAAFALVTPQLAFVLTSWLTPSVQETINTYDPLRRLSEVGALDLLLTGFYPALTWMSFVIAGMALGRLDLSSGTVQRRLAAFGAALTAVAYGMSLLLAGPGALRSLAEDGPSSSGSGSMPLDGSSMLSDGGSFPDMPASMLLTAGPHSGTTFDVIGSVGVAILVIVGATVAMERLPRLRRLAKPVIAVGTMSLTAYVGHFLAQSALTAPGGPSTQQSWTPLLMYVLGATLFAAVWSRFLRRGPLEYVLNAATKPAKHIR
ncbi:heparan-alpha-glucosaminide N-acetyltransferase domain-containing protein [Streptomyces luteogriseus]|uniref:heparan-alpha-glucosaminide N-acetyltransferase domain-containing protein n=1 Tax=Streptomyces luteogriseus TaxID=68233 RepID=UPI0037A3BE88